ncbi:BrnA antitoxin family protein [Candidatus Gottesmanbacteria bacterium]|nr:BrnA antitoxin family protein [Candidatus Gottesmanbacteria bacterium]
MNKLKKIPKFRNEDEEANFWSTHDSMDYVDWSKAIVNPLFPNLKMSTRPITFRITESLYAALKQLANKKDVHYQSLLKVFLAEKVAEEMGTSKTSAKFAFGPDVVDGEGE